MSNVDKKEWQDNYYVCPVSRQPLTPTPNGLFCPSNGVEYPVKNGIVDFVTEDLTKSTSPVLRSVDKLDLLGKIYETSSWYGALDKINAELGIPSIEEGAKMMTEMVSAAGGVGLDVACGTGYMTRSLAQKMRLVYGIDISMGMLEKATEYAQEKGIKNVRFARSSVERLPFLDDVFDGVICSGALHGFPDTVGALKEMARVMKEGARLAVSTILKQGFPTLKMTFERLGGDSIFGNVKALDALHLFDLEELDNYLSQTGFKDFAYNVYGPYIIFHAEKG